MGYYLEILSGEERSRVTLSYNASVSTEGKKSLKKYSDKVLVFLYLDDQLVWANDERKVWFEIANKSLQVNSEYVGQPNAQRAYLRIDLKAKADVTFNVIEINIKEEDVLYTRRLQMPACLTLRANERIIIEIVDKGDELGKYFLPKAERTS
jgi:hypothetical protein